MDATWSAVIDVFADRNWPILNLDKASGLITTDWMNLDRDDMRYVDCGGEGLTFVRATQVRFNVRVKGDDSSATITVNTKFRQQRELEHSSFVVDCQSRGLVETNIQNEVAAAAAQVAAGAKKVKAAAPASAPRGFYCASSPTSAAVGFCTREKAECERTRDMSIGAIPDIAACSLVEGAWCFGDRCAPTQDVCRIMLERAGSGETDCVETR